VCGLVNINCSDFSSLVLQIVQEVTSTNCLSLDARLASGKSFFVERVTNVWNALPPTVNFSKLCTFRTSIVNVDFSRFRVCNFA